MLTRQSRVGTAIRFASAPTIRCRSAHLVGVRSNFVYRQPYQCGERSNTAFGKQSAVQLPSLAPHDSKARLISVTIRRRFMAKPCTPHPIAQRVQLFEIETANVGGRGDLPSRSLGGLRGPFSHAREWPPYPRPLHGAGKNAPLRVRREQYNTVC